MKRANALQALERAAARQRSLAAAGETAKQQADSHTAAAAEAAMNPPEIMSDHANSALPVVVPTGSEAASDSRKR